MLLDHLLSFFNTIISSIISFIATYLAASINKQDTSVTAESSDLNESSKMSLYKSFIEIWNNKINRVFIMAFVIIIIVSLIVPSIYYFVYKPPIEEFEKYTFGICDNKSKLINWISLPVTKGNYLAIDKNKGSFGSLVESVDIQPITTDLTQYGGVSFAINNDEQLNFNNSVVITAMVFIPKDKANQTNSLYSHFICTVQKDGNKLLIFGNDVKLIPGKWTLVTWERSYSFSGDEMLDARDLELSDVSITVWDSSGHYIGNVYFDNITFYRLNN